MKSKLIDTAKILSVSGMLVVTGLGLSACGADAPEGSRETGAANISNFPDGWGSVAHKCDGPNMIYESDHGDSAASSVSVVKDDPRCKVAAP